jgi:MFS family permease
VPTEPTVEPPASCPRSPPPGAPELTVLNGSRNENGRLVRNESALTPRAVVKLPSLEGLHESDPTSYGSPRDLQSLETAAGTPEPEPVPPAQRFNLDECRSQVKRQPRPCKLSCTQTDTLGDPRPGPRPAVASEPMRAALAPLRLPGFRPLALAYTVNELGNWLGEIALAVLVFDQTGSPLATAGLFIGMQFLPAVFAQGLVARVEVAGSRVGLPLIYAVEGATFVALAAIANNFVLAAVIALATVDGALALAGRAFTRAAVAAVLTPTRQLREGNALLNICFTAAGALGPLIAGLVVAGVGARGALLLDAASFALVALVLLVARSVPIVKAEPNPWRKRMREGFAYIGGRPILRRLIGAQAIAFIFFAAVIPIEIVYAKETLGAGDSGYGVLLASWGAGMVVGSLVFAAARRTSLQYLLFVSTATIGLAYLAIAAAGSLTAACVAAGVGGAGNGVQWVSIMSAIQGLTSERYQARVIGLLESSGYAMPGVGFMLGGLLAYLVDPRASFVLAGTGVLAVLAVSVPLVRRTGWTGKDPPVRAQDDLAIATVDPPVASNTVRPRALTDSTDS